MSLHYSRLTERLDTPAGGVWDIHDEAVVRQRAGEDIILLSVGDPDFPTPGYITEHTANQLAAVAKVKQPVEQALRAGTKEAVYEVGSTLLWTGGFAAGVATFGSLAAPA